jgi:hypothetical protein
MALDDNTFLIVFAVTVIVCALFVWFKFREVGELP